MKASCISILQMRKSISLSLPRQNMFEVLTSEEEHLSLLDTLIGHYMSDSSLDPSLPEERRVLSEEEYSDMFRNVHDVRDISAGYVRAYCHRYIYKLL